MSPNVTGALFMITSMVAFVLNDTFLRLTGGDIPLFQLIFIRGIAATTLIFLLAYARGALRGRLTPADRRIIVLRGIAEIVTAYFFLTALFQLPLGNLNAIMQVVPLTVTLGAALIYREAVGWRRMLAILIGLGGVLIIIRPGTEGFTLASLYALAAVLGVTARDLITRRLSVNAPGLKATLGTSLAMMIAAGLASTTEPWAPVSGANAAYIAGSALFICAGYFFSIQVMRTGEISFIAPFRYTGLVVAMIVGFVVFGEVPTLLTVLGALIVVATGVFTFYRERQLSRR